MQRFDFDKHHSIEAGRVFSVCGNTFRMLHETRFAGHFQFIGNFDRHFDALEKRGYIKKTKTGRVITPSGKSLLDKASKEILKESA